MGSLLSLPGLCILDSKKFIDIRNSLHEVWSGGFEVYTDGFLKNIGFAGIMCKTAADFLALDIDIGIGVQGLLSSTIAELQVVALALECVPSFCDVDVYLNSQATIDACVFEMVLASSNFCNCCWIERRHIYNLVWVKDLTVYWIKVKSHSGVTGNIKANTLAGKAANFPVFLPVGVQEHFLMAEDLAVFGNTHHFVRDVFSKVKLLDYAFTCAQDVDIQKVVLSENSAFWASLVGAHYLSSSAVSWVLDLCHSDFGLYLVICKSFVLKEWCEEAIEVFNKKERAVNFVINLVELYCFKVWLLRSEFRACIEKTGLVGNGSVLSSLPCCVDSVLSDGMALFFFFGLDGSSCINIGV
ncbi:hypothetical protein G9A89_017256 [Geosiphon pyriformis]|nr:hypothetical protein G9A89_017256 [Geosiphon pyriformis]